MIVSGVVIVGMVGMFEKPHGDVQVEKTTALGVILIISA
jgi:hypothetical protein